MRALLSAAACAWLTGCITLSWGELPPEQHEFLRAQSQCKDVGRAAQARAEGDSKAYKTAYEACMAKRGY